MYTRQGFAKLIERVGHPALLALAFGIWYGTGKDDVAVLLVQVCMLLVVVALERVVPANASWRLSSGMFAKLVGVYMLGLLVTGLLLAVYESVLMPNLKTIQVPASILLSNLPTAVQIVVLFLVSDLMYYWVHRAIHGSSLFWRVSGHGFHHAFQNLHGINAGSNHPFELIYILLPLIILATIGGATVEAVSGTTALLIANVLLVHANVNMQTPIFSLIITCSNQHRRHHSVVFEESNTNYACNAILWDHVFGTYSEGPVKQTGIGPNPLPIWKMYLLPFREPNDADTVSTRHKRGGAG